jgi:hypothetical protein
MPETEIVGILAISPDIDAVIVGRPGWTEVLRLLGPGSLWAKQEHTHVDPVSPETAKFPAGWRDRRVRIRPPFPAAPVVLVPDLVDVVAA